MGLTFFKGTGFGGAWVAEEVVAAAGCECEFELEWDDIDVDIA